MNEPLKWRKMKKRHTAAVEALLKSNERRCMNACSRYISIRDNISRSAKDNVWILCNKTEDIFAVIIHAKQSLLPVLCGNKIPPPLFLRGFFGAAAIHSLQGKKEDVLIMETELEKIGLYAAEKIDYDLMCIEQQPLNGNRVCPKGLIIRKPQHSDLDALAALQAAYEQEEVLPSASEFNAAASRLNTERIFAQEQMLAAELEGQIIGKINTNARSFSRYQVGGVYVVPHYRGMGIAGKMAHEFISGLASQGRGISLFVKKSNPAARRVYQRIGFEIQGDYRINYY